MPGNISVICSIIKIHIITCKTIFLFKDIVQLNMASIVSDIHVPIFGAKLAKTYAVRLAMEHLWEHNLDMSSLLDGACNCCAYT